MKSWVKVVQFIAGVWGLAGVVWCVLLLAGRVPQAWLWPNPDNHLAVLIAAVFPPFAFTAARMTQIGLNTDRFAPRWHQQQFLGRLGQVWQRFPFTGILMLLLFVGAVAVLTVSGLPEAADVTALSGRNPEYAGVMVFYALTAFMDLRVFTSGGRLIARWKKEDE